MKWSQERERQELRERMTASLKEAHDYYTELGLARIDFATFVRAAYNTPRQIIIEWEGEGPSMYYLTPHEVGMPFPVEGETLDPPGRNDYEWRAPETKSKHVD